MHPGRCWENFQSPAEPLAIAQVLIWFPGAETASQRVAGVPAAARAVHSAVQAGFTEIIVCTPQHWWPDRAVRAEVLRLGGNASVRFLAESAALADAVPGAVVIEGADLPDASSIGSAAAGEPVRLDVSSAADLLNRRSSELLLATAKPGDGIVSRYLNRPVSQTISGMLLRVPGITPFHATLGTAALAVLMLAALLFGGPAGLIAGALLFQAASIFDGVDGEIARATFRTSPEGARLDSLIDAATNLAFIAGTAFNLYLQGDTQSALCGSGGLAIFALGLTIIGLRSRNRATGLTFNAVKEQVAKQRSRLMTLLTWLTMRDFFALAFAVLIAAGFARFAMTAFAIVVTGWFVVVVLVMRRKA